MLRYPVVRLLLYALITAVTILAVYVFLAGGNFIGKLDAFY